MICPHCLIEGMGAGVLALSPKQFADWTVALFLTAWFAIATVIGARWAWRNIS